MTSASMAKLEYFYKVTRDGLPVPGSLQRVLVKPKGSEWRQLDYELCCPNEIDVFLIAGQSNAKGRATDAPSPIITGDDILQVNNNVITVANDPVGVGINQAVNYSAWPQFGITYNELTGRKVAFVPTAVSGTGQQANTDIGFGNWSTSGTLFNTSVTKLNNSLEALTTAGYIPVFKGILWIQGENDADGINNSTATQAGYITALQTMLTNYRAIYGATMNFWMVRIGTRVGFSDVGYAQIRDAQETVAATDPYTHIIYRGTVEFPARGLMNDAYHYKVEGYNEIGRIGASEVINLS